MKFGVRKKYANNVVSISNEWRWLAPSSLSLSRSNALCIINSTRTIRISRACATEGQVRSVCLSVSLSGDAPRSLTLRE